MKSVEFETLLTARDVAAILSCSVSAVYTMARRGEIASVRIGGMIRFRTADISAAITESNPTRKGWK